MQPESSATALVSREQCAEAVVHLIETAHSGIAVFSQQLEPLLYNHSSVCQHVSQLARSQRHARIRLLALSTREVAANGHCLIELAQRLPSSIQIRIPATEELQRFSESWLIVDDHSLFRMTNPQRYEGVLIENDRLHIKTQMEYFDQAWENSEPDQNTRRLSL